MKKNFENFMLAMKNRVALKFFTVLNICFTSRSFEQLALALKNWGCPEFTVLNILLIIQDFWATCACPEKLRVPWIHSAEYTFYYSGFLSYLRLPWKTELPRYVSLHGIYFLLSEFLSNLHALALKNRVALIFFTVLNLLFTFRIFE